MKAVSNLLFGIEINHYLSFTMDAVALVNDLVGGVQVEVLDDLTFLDPALRKGETVTLKGGAGPSLCSGPGRAWRTARISIG